MKQASEKNNVIRNNCYILKIIFTATPVFAGTFILFGIDPSPDLCHRSFLPWACHHLADCLGAWGREIEWAFVQAEE